ncbi:MAG: ParB/RepB/Spo0J family partition protein [Clostridiales Family XIII bacterium]|jgi:ParB family chromosome partitioning protein|nr:ParB/RepB/Spo0J family partition protein [Clostridiales Family XIII bacterium]
MSAGRLRKGLGRGLDALIDEASREVSLEENGIKEGAPEGGVLYIDTHGIKPNANQPRKTFRQEAIDGLASSIREHGVIQPLIVRQARDGYELVAGERRWRAAIKAGLKAVPCLVREISDEQNVLFALIENIQREDLNPIEEAEAIRQTMDALALTQEEISKSIGKSRPYISNALRLLRLPGPIRGYLAEGALSGGHGKAIASVADPEKQMLLAEHLVKKGCSVREAESLAADPRFGEPRRSARPRPKDRELLYIEEGLRRAFGTKVSITGNGERGRIELEYFSREELEGLIERLSV